VRSGSRERQRKGKIESAVGKVNGTGGNRAGLAGSRWYQSGPVPNPARFPPPNRAYKFRFSVNWSVSPVN
jgi:hypothetical protein